ncbi:MAG TPA: hypothetical protein VF100_12625, partial [Thermoanaerobaculia bacterium]
PAQPAAPPADEARPEEAEPPAVATPSPPPAAEPAAPAAPEPEAPAPVERQPSPAAPEPPPAEAPVERQPPPPSPTQPQPPVERQPVPAPPAEAPAPPPVEAQPLPSSPAEEPAEPPVERQPAPAPPVEAPAQPPAAAPVERQPVTPPVEAPARPAVPKTPPAAQPAPPPVPPPAAEPELPPAPPRFAASGAGECPDCHQDEAAAVVERTVAPGGAACGPEITPAAVEVARQLAGRATGPQPLEGGRLGAWTAGQGCQVLGVLLPPGATHRGYRYEVESGDAAGRCYAGEECPVPGAAWPERPVIRQLDDGSTLVYGLFRNSSPERARRARLTVYYRP